MVDTYIIGDSGADKSKFGDWVRLEDHEAAIAEHERTEAGMGSIIMDWQEKCKALRSSVADHEAIEREMAAWVEQGGCDMCLCYEDNDGNCDSDNVKQEQCHGKIIAEFRRRSKDEGGKV